MEPLTLKISGMSCAGCQRSVTRVLGAAPGVQAMEVDLEQGEAMLVIDPALTDRAQLSALVTDAGFDAR